MILRLTILTIIGRFATMTNVDAVIWAFSGSQTVSPIEKHFLSKARICAHDTCSITFNFGDEEATSSPFAVLFYGSKDMTYQRKFSLSKGFTGRRDDSVHTLILELVADESQELPSFLRPVVVNNTAASNSEEVSEVVVVEVDEGVSGEEVAHNNNAAINDARDALIKITEEFNAVQNALMGCQKFHLRKRRRDALLAKNLKLVQELKEQEKKNAYVAAIDSSGQEIFPSSSEVSALLMTLSSKLDNLLAEFADSAEQSNDQLQILEDFILMQQNVNDMLSDEALS